MSSQPVSPRAATAAPVPFNSRIFKMMGTAAVLTVSVLWVLPAVASQWEVTVDPLLIKSLLGTALVGVATFAYCKIYKELKYEGSFVYTIFNSSFRGQSWWTEIDENFVLGALPLEYQMDRIKALGITHVISVVEPFELEPGIVQPTQSEQWRTMGIEHKHIEAPDFYGVPTEKIHEGIKYIHEELQKNPKAKFYIHCKAGRGRSATLLLCYKMKTNNQEFDSKEKTYDYLKRLRPHINLNENQMLAAQDYLNSDLFKTKA
jgi:protein-tyrosine phosphatase